MTACTSLARFLGGATALAIGGAMTGERAAVTTGRGEGTAKIGGSEVWVVAEVGSMMETWYCASKDTGAGCEWQVTSRQPWAVGTAGQRDKLAALNAGNFGHG